MRVTLSCFGLASSRRTRPWRLDRLEPICRVALARPVEPRLRRLDLLLQPRGLDQGEQALEPARRHGLHAVHLVRARQIDLARPEPLREIVGGKADAPLRGAKAKRLAHRPAEPGARLLMPRPDAFVEAAENHEVGLLQPRFERSPDEQPRMQRRARPHHLAGNQAAIERRIVSGREREAVACVDQLGEQDGERFAGIALPQARG